MSIKNILKTIAVAAGLAVASVAVASQPLFPNQGGTGTTTEPLAGQILIGTNGKIYVPAFLTAGTGISIATSSGGIIITSTANGATTTINGLSSRDYTFNTSGTGLTISTSSPGTVNFDWTNPGYITSSALSPYLLISTASSTYYPLTNPAGYIATTTGNWLGTWQTYNPSDFLSSSTPISGAQYWNLSGSDLTASSTAWNVGIGTNSPTSKLHVNGNIYSTSGRECLNCEGELNENELAQGICNHCRRELSDIPKAMED